MTAGSWIAFRVDASSRIGIGHVMRCLALADELRSHGARTRFVCRPLPGTLVADVRGRGHELSILPDGPVTAPEADAEATVAALSDGSPWSWLVVDHYGLGEAWETLARRAASKILAVDDLASRRHDADVLLDQGLYPRNANPYRGLVPAACRVLLGPGFALIRSEFRSLPVRTREGLRVNVSFGGTDPSGMTLRALRALEILDELRLEVDVVLGSASPHLREVAEACESFREHCASGIEPVRARIAENLGRSLMLVTALAPHVGYDAAARVAKTANASGKTLREVAIELRVATGEEFDRWVRPEDMVGRR